MRKHQGGSRSGLSGIHCPVKNLNRNPRQANQLPDKRLMHRTKFTSRRRMTCRWVRSSRCMVTVDGRSTS